MCLLKMCVLGAPCASVLTLLLRQRYGTAVKSTASGISLPLGSTLT